MHARRKAPRPPPGRPSHDLHAPVDRYVGENVDQVTVSAVYPTQRQRSAKTTTTPPNTPPTSTVDHPTEQNSWSRHRHRPHTFQAGGGVMCVIDDDREICMGERRPSAASLPSSGAGGDSAADLPEAVNQLATHTAHLAETTHRTGLRAPRRGPIPIDPRAAWSDSEHPSECRLRGHWRATATRFGVAPWPDQRPGPSTRTSPG